MMGSVFQMLHFLQVLYAPEAAGSGIPEVMGYLNGVHIRKMFKTRTLLAKIWG